MMMRDDDDEEFPAGARLADRLSEIRAKTMREVRRSSIGAEWWRYPVAAAVLVGLIGGVVWGVHGGLATSRGPQSEPDVAIPATTATNAITDPDATPKPTHRGGVSSSSPSLPAASVSGGSLAAGVSGSYGWRVQGIVFEVTVDGGASWVADPLPANVPGSAPDSSVPFQFTASFEGGVVVVAYPTSWSAVRVLSQKQPGGAWTSTSVTLPWTSEQHGFMAEYNSQEQSRGGPSLYLSQAAPDFVALTASFYLGDAVRYGGNAVLTSNNAGASFTAVSSNAAAGDTVAAVAWASPTEGAIVGSAYHPVSDELWVTEDGGSNWSLMPRSQPGEGGPIDAQLVANSGGIYFAVPSDATSDRSGSLTFFNLADGKVTPYGTPVTLSGKTGNSFAILGESLWVYNDGQLHRSADAGAHWTTTPVANDPQGGIYLAPTFSTALDGQVVASVGMSCPASARGLNCPDQVTMSTHDGGMTWQADDAAKTEQAAKPTAPPVAPQASPSARVPTLGLRGAWYAGAGFGMVRPAQVFLGGDPTGNVTDVTWQSWGGPQAIGTGTSTYVGPGQHTSQGTPEKATIVAFDPAMCNGTYAYQAVEWYFPQHGNSFNPNVYTKACVRGYEGQ